MRSFGKWLGRFLLIGVAIGGIVFFGFVPAYVEDARNNVLDHAPYPVSDRAQALHDSLIVGDWHADPLLWSRDLTERGTRGQVDIPRLIEGNVALQVFTAVTKSPAGLNYDHNDPDAFDNITLLAVAQMWPHRTWTSLYERAAHQADKLHDFEARSAGRLKIIKTAADLETVLEAKARGEKIVGGILGIEGGHPLEGRIENLDRLVDKGYRLIALQHFFDNELGGTLHSRANNGLTDFGRQVVREVARRPLILDVAHSSTRVVEEVLEMTDIPLVLSHTGIHSHCEAHRNIPDDLMKRVAETGGVVGIGYWRDVTCDESPAGIAATIKAAIALLGEDHVSLGSDFDGAVETAFDTSELSALTQAMLDAGLTEAQIRKVAGGNMVRVLRARLGAGS
ncbi:dipeptidase [Jhaorihella thermophila]|uniref:Zn-dependent dipeptidase, dipeptidase homolog n=1 Tax=Jhaorihella thermophila TaxID=488547 RepID=A0A1H5WP71_9RHOB|nr:membrane dipeptidase [Jhaorihella thermophila]SEG01073.1 Zn-dependent dipeptidase, dipeptidase homolog [Jhaorihella thermophila]